MTTVGTLSTITAGETHIGSTTGAGISISVTPTVTAAGAYAAKDAVGGEMTFANAVRVAGGSGIINSVTIADNDGEKPAWSCGCSPLQSQRLPTTCLWTSRTLNC